MDSITRQRIKEAVHIYKGSFFAVWLSFVLFSVPLIFYFTHENTFLCGDMCVLAVLIGIILALSHIMRVYEAFLEEEKNKISESNRCRMIEYNGRYKAGELSDYQEKLERIYTFKDLDEFKKAYYDFIIKEHFE